MRKSSLKLAYPFQYSNVLYGVGAPSIITTELVDGHLVAFLILTTFTTVCGGKIAENEKIWQ